MIQNGLYYLVQEKGNTIKKLLLIFLTTVLSFAETDNICKSDNQLGDTICSIKERAYIEEEIKNLIVGLQNKKYNKLFIESQNRWESFVASACTFENTSIDGSATHAYENYCYIDYAKERIERLKRYEELP